MMVTVFVLIVCLVWELVKPARQYTKPEKKNSYVTNAGIFLFNNAITYVLSIGIIFVTVQNFAVHDLFSFLPMWLQYVVGILLLDVIIWFWHMINHRVPALWSFHQAP